MSLEDCKDSPISAVYSCLSSALILISNGLHKLSNQLKKLITAGK